MNTGYLSKVLFMGSLIPLFWTSQECTRFPEFLQNFSERQILWSLCLVAFPAFI